MSQSKVYQDLLKIPDWFRCKLTARSSAGMSKRGGRLKRGAELLVASQASEDGCCPLAGQPAEKTAAKGGKSEAQGDAGIDVGGLAHDPLVHTVRIASSSIGRKSRSVISPCPASSSAT